jgi:thiamine biosynthesis lipoprotein
MKKTKILMGMPITVNVVDDDIHESVIDQVFSYFNHIDEKFSMYKRTSEISLINSGLIDEKQMSEEMHEVLRLCGETERITSGYFNYRKKRYIDPTGLVKGWSVHNACVFLKNLGSRNFYIDAGGDIEFYGNNDENEKWRVGIRNPSNTSELVKVLSLSKVGIATSGNYERGDHIYGRGAIKASDYFISVTVVGPNVYEADRFATATFAMGGEGVEFLERLKEVEAYMIKADGIATYTSGFQKYVLGTAASN